MPMNQPTTRRVVVTGMGAISPLGNTVESLWDHLDSQRSGVRALTIAPPDSLPLSYAAEARDFRGEIEDFGPLEKEQKKAIRKGLKVMCRECQMGVAAAQLALADARLTVGRFDPVRAGVAYGSDYMITMPDDFGEAVQRCLDDFGEFQFSRWAGQGLPKMSPLWLLKYLPNMPASHIAIYNDLQGPNNSATHREASAGLAVSQAIQSIRQGRADIMLVGATGTRLHPMKMVHAIQQEEIATGNGDPRRASRPFDLHRRGMVLGEGAGAIILEDLTNAQARGARIYGEVLGAASSSSTDRNRMAQRERALQNVIGAVLRNCEFASDKVGSIHAHGLSTQSGDIEEARAICHVFGDRAQSLHVTAAKSYFGNLGAGGGLVELVAGILSLEKRKLFPVLNYDTPDPQCPVRAVQKYPVEPGNSLIKLSVTPQGQATAVLVCRFEG